MPVGGDLGFSYPVVVAVLLVVGQVVIGLVVRHKWRASVARGEEIKRLLVLASEEAARAELEASINYYAADTPAVISPPLQYQCAVCFCPTTTRCARCKAVRYCSGKCQIIHWRQGHKEECQPFTSSYHSDDAGGDSCQKVLKQGEYEIHGNSSETDGRPCSKSGQNFPEEPARLKSDCFPEVFCGNDDSEVECFADGKAKDSSLHVAERLDGNQSTNVFRDKLKASCVNNVDESGQPSSKSMGLVDSTDCLTSPGKLHQIKPDCADDDTQCGSTSSSGWSADGSNESSFSEPSTPSSGFWEGTINSRKPKIDSLDDSAQSSSSGAGDADLQNFRSFPSVSEAVEHHSTALGIKEPVDGTVLSQEIREDTSKGSSSPLSRLKMSDPMDVNSSGDSLELKSGEPRYYSSSTYAYTTSSAGGPSVTTHASKVSSMRPLSHESSDHAVNNTSSTSHLVDSKKGRSVLSGASAANLSSSPRRHSLQGSNPGNVESANGIATSSKHACYSPKASNGLKTSTRNVVDHLKAGRYNIKGVFPYELFVKLYNWNNIELQPFGLTNCGNSCYANAVLQCLACTPPLTAYLLQGLHRKACERKEWCFTCEFESLILKAKGGISPLSPMGILSQIHNIGSHLGNGKEEDAHEFLRYAIDTMQSVCLKEVGVKVSSSLEEETSLVGLTFGGYLRSKIKCLKCGGKSERHERMMDLTVEIEGDIGTLEEALRQFTGTEILDGENKYQCSRCRSYERAKKKLTIQEAPNILTIALKRFQSGKFGKLNKSIQFPEILDLAPYMSGTSDKSPVYGLYGVVVHLDIMNAAFSGHYVCYVKNVQKKWFKIDDSTVMPVELESVLTRKAYMLLYARCSPRAPRLIRDSIISRDPRKPKNTMFKPRSNPTSPWDASIGGPLNGHTGIGSLYPNHTSLQHIRTILEEDSSSDNSSSIFSEGCSCSTDSSNRDSTNSDDYDHFLGDLVNNWNSSWKNSSDSDSTSSCSSSSSSPSPLYSRHSPNAGSDRHSTKMYCNEWQSNSRCGIR